MSHSDAAFDRALGAWENRQLDRHLSEEQAWDEAYDKAELTIWTMTFSDVYELLPPSIVRDFDLVSERVVNYVAEEILEGRWDE